nr:hypothetical protein B0A51_02184 [Rachicladosporium sp. CCFEE 5018]
MEKYGQYRDKGSGIAPFFPISPQAVHPLLLPWHLFVFSIRIPFLLFACFVWFAFVQFLTPGTLLRKANLWCIIGIPGIWWIDLQVDGVRRGSLGKAPASSIPSAGSVIAASYTSPIDIIYLATILDPIFTQSYPDTKLVRPLSFTGALLACFTVHTSAPKASDTGLVPLSTLTARNPSRIICVFPEGTPSNGRSILHPTPSLLSASPRTKIYPVSLRYTPADIVTPIPSTISGLNFLWVLLSSHTHVIRTRIGAPMRNTATAESTTSAPSKLERRNSYQSNYFDTLKENSDAEAESQARNQKGEDGLTGPERSMLDVVADALARLGRVKRVSLGVREKGRFVEAWGRGKGSSRKSRS